jgi:hypothetical protein
MDNLSVLQLPDNMVFMVFTLGRGFVFGGSFGLRISFAPLSRFGLPRRGHRLFGNVISFW